MATKMELVLSPGSYGDGPDGSPYRNEDVQEWSRVDRITGMLERARVETGRWRADTDDARQSYGKMIDSRERNSADGSLVQKARRQVEIFQSQGTSGRSFQVVRASQWSSSKATDSAIDVPLAKPSNSQFVENTMNGDTSSFSPRLNLWRSSLDSKASDLDQLSCLCRKLHNEAMNHHNKLWSLHSGIRTPSPLLSSIEQVPTDLQELEINDRLSNSSISERRSNSTEDLSSLLNVEDAFARDCKTRRSLQIPNSDQNHHNHKSNEFTEDNRVRRSRNEFIAERARRFEEGLDRTDERKTGIKKNFISTKSFTSIADNDFVKNDPNHPSKFNHQSAKLAVQDNSENSQTVQVSSPVLSRASKMESTTSSSSTTTATRKANNKTVVHLRNIASPTKNVTEPRCINVTAIKLEKDSEPQIENISKENGLYSMLADTTTKEDTPLNTTTTTALVNGVKPVKKVEFCKTEIHFAADSGKVNIVETDGKPPPTNKFRRRRRNNSLGAATNNNTQKNNLPVVHFGDTSYEKYIFGGGKLPLDNKKTVELTDNSIIEESNKKYSTGIIESLKRDRWDSPEKFKEDENSGKEISTIKDSYLDMNNEKIDHSNKYRGTHTTTVSLFNNENNPMPKVNEGRKCHGIQLQFAASNRSLSPLNSDDESVVNHTTKITVHLPPVIAHHPRKFFQNNLLSNLKSVRLVMSIGQANDAGPSLKQFLSTLYDPTDGLTLSEDNDSPKLWSLKLKSNESSEDSDVDVRQPILDESRMITGKPSSSFSTTNDVELQTDISPISDRLPISKNQVISKDTDNNQVLLKIVSTHKPTIAHVESDPPYPLKSRSKSPLKKNEPRDEDNAMKYKIGDNNADIETKDHCDNREINDMVSSCIEAPTYENIFDAVTDGAPVYENFQVIRDNNSPVIKDKKLTSDKIALKKRATAMQSDKVRSNSYDKGHKKISSKLSNGSVTDGSAEKTNKLKSDKSKSTRSVTPMSTLSSIKSDKNSVHSDSKDNVESKRTNKSSSRSLSNSRDNSIKSSSRDNSIKRYKDVKYVKDDNVRSSQAKKRNNSKFDSTTQEHKNTVSSINSEKNGVTRTKKPVEVVYQTAVYNMKNEKLSNPKGKEVKGPRLINDLICGSKLKRPSDNKKIIKSAIVSQNTSKRKEAPTSVNR